MGTRRSKHNKGRKPLYKDFERTTLTDLSRGFEAEAEHFLKQRAQDNYKILKPIGRRSEFCKVAPIPELEAVVARYIAARDAQKEPLAPTPVRMPECIRLDAPPHIADPKQTAPISHDILLQLFSERKISQGHFHAGRRWQWDKEAAVLQPVISIDWSGSSPSPYQHDGELSERQWDAIRRRKHFITYAGIAACTMLDIFLEVDRGRADLVQLMKMPAIQIECAVEDLLEKICECFA